MLTSINYFLSSLPIVSKNETNKHNKYSDQRYSIPETSLQKSAALYSVLCEKFRGLGGNCPPRHDFFCNKCSALYSVLCEKFRGLQHFILYIL